MQIVEAKRLVLDEVQGVRSRETILEDLRKQLVSAMRFGQTLYIRLADGAPNFNNNYCDPAFFPLALFDHEHLRSLRT